MSQTDLWKIHPIVNFIIFGHETGRFLGNSSKIGLLVEQRYSKKSGRDTDAHRFLENSIEYGRVFQKLVWFMPRYFVKTE